MVCVCPSSVRLNEWSASSRAAPGQSAAAWVPDGVNHLAMLGEPLRSPPVQCRYFLGPRPAQLQPQQIGEQVVVAEPRPVGVQRHDKRAGVLDFEQDPF